MAHSYTPGLKVLKNTKILKERRLPVKGAVSTSLGNSVKPDDIIAKTDLPGNVQMVNVANQLNVDASDVKEVMVAEIGSEVVKNELIAETKGLFGFFKSSVNSPVSGTIESISDLTGQVVIREAPLPVEVDAYIEGVIDEVIEKEGVVVKSQGVFIQGIFGIGGESRGEIKILLINHGNEAFEIEHQMRIAQMVVAKYERIQFKLVEQLTESKRGDGGFGSTGTK